MARAEEESGGPSVQPRMLREKNRSAPPAEDDDDNDEVSAIRRHRGGYAATYAVSVIAARRNRLSSTHSSISGSKAGILMNNQVTDAESLGWLDAVPSLPMQTVLKAALPLSDPERRENGIVSDRNRGEKSERTNSSRHHAAISARDSQGKDGLLEKGLERALFILGPSNPVRKVCVKVANSQLFGLLVHLSVLLSSALLVVIPAAEDLPGQGSITLSKSTRQTIDFVTTCVFSVEFLLVVVAQVIPIQNQIQMSLNSFITFRPNLHVRTFYAQHDGRASFLHGMHILGQAGIWWTFLFCVLLGSALVHCNKVSIYQGGNYSRQVFVSILQPRVTAGFKPQIFHSGSEFGLLDEISI